MITEILATNLNMLKRLIMRVKSLFHKTKDTPRFKKTRIGPVSNCDMNKSATSIRSETLSKTQEKDKESERN